MNNTRFTTLILAGVLSLGLLTSCSNEKNTTDQQTDTQAVSVENEKTTPESYESMNETEDIEAGESLTDGNTQSVGDIITFGSYEQDDDITNGTEAIEWILLDVKDGAGLVISKYALDYKSYHDEWTDITWESCSLRAWLNNEFYNSAFSEAEKDRIEITEINSEEIYVNDSVFLLSIEEAEQYFASDEERKCEPTVFAKNSGVSTLDGGCWWLLRSPGGKNDKAAGVRTSGGLYTTGNDVNFRYAIRPAMWIELAD